MTTCSTCRFFRLFPAETAHGQCFGEPGLPMNVDAERPACRFHALRVVTPKPEFPPNIDLTIRGMEKAREQSEPRPCIPVGTRHDYDAHGVCRYCGFASRGAPFRPCDHVWDHITRECSRCGEAE